MRCTAGRGVRAVGAAAALGRSSNDDAAQPVGTNSCHSHRHSEPDTHCPRRSAPLSSQHACSMSGDFAFLPR